MNDRVDQIKRAAEEIIDAVRASGPPQVALPALGYAVAELLRSVTPLSTATESARDLFVRQLDQHLAFVSDLPAKPS